MIKSNTNVTTRSITFILDSFHHYVSIKEEFDGDEAADYGTLSAANDNADPNRTKEN